MENHSDEYIKSIISKVGSTCKLLDVTYNIKSFDVIGQNYFGDLIPFELSGLDVNDKKVCLHLIMKLAPTDERFRVSGALTLFFAKEIYIYSTLLPAYKNIELDISSKLNYISPKCYYICREYCKEVLVIQDMRSMGYKIYTEQFLDYNHIRISLIALAKFHALSFILKTKDFKLYQEVADVCVPLNKNTNKRFMQILEDRLDKALLKFKDTKYELFLQDLRAHYEKYIGLVAESDSATVICHGDIWKENLLFKYENEDPVSACLIDYQTARLSNPAYDTLFLIITSTNTEVRRQHFKDLIDIYYSTIESMLCEANMSDVYPRIEFEKDIRKCVRAAIIIANTALWLASGLQQEGHVRSKVMFKNEEDGVRAVSFYKSVISDVIDDFSSFGYLNL